MVMMNVSKTKQGRGRPKGSGPYKWNAKLTVRLRRVDVELLHEAHELEQQNRGFNSSFNLWLVANWRDKYRSVLQGDEK